ncbi:MULTISPECIES: hypothetical protein [Halorubrum]|uniref:Uncharacterized protein n=1 Tax=Halorubrum tropicale TaxID=1765655 RepID=A0A0M9AUT6_9EURY|nr:MULTISPECIES: hypothetical protein [Halorubrum]KOX97961.1 hypothetical protein AMR74_03405 [Halorubrum tropicale]RLM50500.1 hypothetical protein DVK06_09670 [Halorubrum sp. Atlit-28R]TKX42369.1 hypothetical protein EXE50_14350 [Halorubrum sp. ARQ200]TKX48890.1 hypothetical protein EXE49_14785 [Halorubrum sp. ASP121]TKX58058.1 hypothetical protein EXE48_17015 [Halorubrum sp. ASP1]
MYARTFGTEWDDLSREEAVERAFALGVASCVGDPRPAELDRVLRDFDGEYDRSIIQLAYDQGRTKALEATAERDDPEADEVWAELVDGLGEPRESPVPAALPGAIRELTLTDEPPEGPPSSLDLPSMLRK